MNASELISWIKKLYEDHVQIPHTEVIRFTSESNSPLLEKIITSADGHQEKFLYELRETEEYKIATAGYNTFQKLSFESGVLGEIRRGTHYYQKS